MIKDSALDRLFPESMRYHKGHVADPDHKGGAGARSRLVRLTPRQKLAGIVRRAPEVMLKIGRANIRCLQHMKAAADYISRNGKLEIEDQDGFTHGSKEQVQAVVRQWGLQSQIPPRGVLKRSSCPRPPDHPLHAGRYAARGFQSSMPQMGSRHVERIRLPDGVSHAGK